MYRKAILKVLSKSDEKWQSCCANEPNSKIHCSAPLKPPKNHWTMTKMNRLYLLCIEKLSWRFYWNRMKNGRAVVLTSQIPKFTVCPLKPPKNHRTMTKMNRVYLLGTEKLYWRFYQNRMKNGRAIVLTRKLHGQTTLWLQYPSLPRGKNGPTQKAHRLFS